MLKTNSKKARENIRAYIMKHEHTADTSAAPCNTFEEVAAAILKDFERVRDNDATARTYTRQAYFEEYAGGLPHIIDTCYYYNRNARDDLGDILEETEAERNRYSESAAAAMLSKLIYSEIERSARK